MRRTHLASLLALAAALTGCNTTPEPYEPTTELLVPAQVEDGAESLPAVVAVMPVVDRVERPTGAPFPLPEGAVPVVPVREALAAGLPGRRYAPLALAFLDRRSAGDTVDGDATDPWIDASARAREGAADATLEVSITAWDETWLQPVASVRAEAEVYLYPVEGGEPLLGVRLSRELRLPLATAPVEAEDRRAALGALLAEEILERIPERDPLAGSTPEE